MHSLIAALYLSVSPDHMPSSEKGEGKSYAGYTDLHGEIVTVTVTKVCKKLGIAIDGGANTKQKAVIIREISVSLLDLVCNTLCVCSAYWGFISMYVQGLIRNCSVLQCIPTCTVAIFRVFSICIIT